MPSNEERQGTLRFAGGIIARVPARNLPRMCIGVGAVSQAAAASFGRVEGRQAALAASVRRWPRRAHLFIFKGYIRAFPPLGGLRWAVAEA